MTLQTIKLRHDKLTETISIPLPEYIAYIREIVRDVKKEQSPKQLRNIRTKIYNLLIKGI